MAVTAVATNDMMLFSGAVVVVLASGFVDGCVVLVVVGEK
jgi:hypothetical protein